MILMIIALTGISTTLFGALISSFAPTRQVQKIGSMILSLGIVICLTIAFNI